MTLPVQKLLFVRGVPTDTAALRAKAASSAILETLFYGPRSVEQVRVRIYNVLWHKVVRQPGPNLGRKIVNQLLRVIKP